MILMITHTVTSTRAKWKSLRDGFQRRVKNNPNADHLKSSLSFLLKSEANITSELPIYSKIVTASDTQESIVIETGKESASSDCSCAKMEDDLILFFRGIASTMRNFTRLQVAEIKLEISNLVGRAEIEISKQEHDRVLLSFDPSTAVTYVLNPTDSQGDSNGNYISTPMNTMTSETGLKQ